MTPSLSPTAQAQAVEPQEYVLMLSAQVSPSPAKIRLEWPRKPTAASSYTVHRKSKEASSWGTPLATLNGSATFYEDTGVVVGQAYEYRVASGNYTGYLLAGIQVPAVEFRGKLVLLVEAEQAAALSVELESFQKSLVGDGWTVVRHEVSRNATPQSAQALVRAEYNAEPNHVKAVFLLGHIPVLKSGNIAPDAHADHRGPWPADAYYGTMDASWQNSPSSIPGHVHLQVGRVDFDKMPAFQKNATELLRQYLNKNHKYRLGHLVTTKDALVSDGFGRTHADRAAVFNAHRLFPALWGSSARVDEGAWAPLLSQNSYTWGHINGGGSYTSCAAVGGSLTTGYMASAQNFGIVFAQTFGSYFGDWDTPNNLMRAFLATPDYGLASMWTGRPHWFFHPMALGETLGYSARLTQNNRTGGLYAPVGTTGVGQIHIALMGDPSLRMFPVLPATQLRAQSISGETRLQWTASADTAVSDYYVYGAPTPEGPYVRLGIAKTTQWTHTNPGNTKHYMVRASKLTSTGSGSFYNLSQGTMAMVETLVEVDSAAIGVGAPATGARPNATVSSCGPHFGCSAVTWTPDNERFQGNTRYSATVTLTAQKGYVFSAGLTASMNGQAATVSNHHGTQVTLSYAFAATSAAMANHMSLLTQPTKLGYEEGEALELSGLVVRLSFNDGTTASVPFAEFLAHDMRAEPPEGTVLRVLPHHGMGVRVSHGGLPLHATTHPLTVTPLPPGEPPPPEEAPFPPEEPPFPPEEAPSVWEEPPLGMLKGVGCNSTGSPFGVVALLVLAAFIGLRLSHRLFR